MNIADFQAVFQHWGGADVLPNVGDTAITRALKRKNLLQALEVRIGLHKPRLHLLLPCV